MEAFPEYLRFLIEPPVIFYVGGAVIVLCVVLLGFARYRRANRGIVPFKSKDGHIEIAPGTVKSLITHVVSEVAGVEDVTCRLLNRRKITVCLALHVRASARLQDIESDTKRRVRHALRHQFGMENIDSIHIRVTKVIGSPAAIEDELDDADEAPLPAYRPPESKPPPRAEPKPEPESLDWPEEPPVEEPASKDDPPRRD